MTAKSLSKALVISAFSVVLAASAAHAACDSRPGTPNEVKAEALGGEFIRFSWRNTTHRGMNKSGSTSQDPRVKMWFDISVRNGDGTINAQDKGGAGPFDVNYGSRHHQDFKTCVPCRLCFQIRARTAGGTKGCVSAQFSAQVCATTVAAAPDKPKTDARDTSGPPRISVTRRDGNVFVVTGNGFVPNKRVAIRMVDSTTLRGPIVTSIGGRAILSKANGTIDILLTGMCNQTPGPLAFSANDGRTSRTDKTGTLWSNTVTVSCQR